MFKERAAEISSKNRTTKFNLNKDYPIITDACYCVCAVILRIRKTSYDV